MIEERHSEQNPRVIDAKARQFLRFLHQVITDERLIKGKQKGQVKRSAWESIAQAVMPEPVERFVRCHFDQVLVFVVQRPEIYARVRQLLGSAKHADTRYRIIPDKASLAWEIADEAGGEKLFFVESRPGFMLLKRRLKPRVVKA